MTRGREAARAARRREGEANEKITALKAEVAELKKAHREEQAALRSELTILKENIRKEAVEIASRELAKAFLDKEEERRKRGLSDDIVDNLAWRKDLLVYNACRFMSMSEGIDPLTALARVMTWMTGKRYGGGHSTDLFIEQGLPQGGWVCTFVHRNKNVEHRFWEMFAKDGEHRAVDLDTYAEEQPDKIHPRYDRMWYAQAPDPDKKKLAVVDQHVMHLTNRGGGSKVVR